MSMSPRHALAGLGVEIDRVDSAMHELPIDRGRIIDRLTEIKGARAAGRPSDLRARRRSI